MSPRVVAILRESAIVELCTESWFGEKLSMENGGLYPYFEEIHRPFYLQLRPAPGPAPDNYVADCRRRVRR